MSEPLMDLLAGLPSAEPDPARAGQIRMRCRARLARQAPRADTRHPTATRLWQPLILVLGGAYLTGIIVQALRVYRLP